jgi:hypothetical protein
MRSLATDSLSSAAQQIMAACFRSKLPAAMTAAKIKAETGEIVAVRTIGRRKSEWTAAQLKRQADRDRMVDLIAAMKDGNLTASEMVTALAMEALLKDPDGFSKLNPLEVQRTSLEAEKVKLAHRREDLRARQVALAEKKYELMQQREAKAIEAAKDLAAKSTSGQQITPEDIQRIRDIYGLNS